MRELICFVFLLGLCVAQQCEDAGGTELCLSILKGKNGLCVKLSEVELASCRKTCKACLPSSSSSNERPPSWALARPSPRPPNRRPNNNPPASNEDDSVQLPLYAVILIIIAVIAIFIGVTVCIIKMKKKWKRRKMKKNRFMLQNAPPAPDTLHRNYLWSQTGNYNGAYYPEMDDWSRNAYLTANDAHQHKALNNSEAVTQENSNTRNLDVIKNATKEKRKAPEPPAESPYQNLSSNPPNGNKPKSKAPAPPPGAEQAKKENQEIVEIPIDCTESVFSIENTLERDKKQKKTSVDSWGDPPTLPTRPPIESPKKSPRKRRKRKSKRRSKDRSTSTSDSDESSSEETHQSPPAIVKILNEWKDHLLEQKKELEEYHKNLANYVQNLPMKTANEKERSQNEQMENWLKSVKSEKPGSATREQNIGHISERQYASIPINYQLNFPEPPESVRGDFAWEPNDAKGQKQVIMDLKKKIFRLQTLLESTQDAADSERRSNDWHVMSKVDKESKYQSMSEMLSEDKITIKTLLQRLEGRECTKLQLRIAQALDNSKKRGRMNIESRDGPITCLSKQIHHVMTDILDPRTSTKIDLGAHAACTLANKLLKSVHANLLPVLRAKNPRMGVEKTTERISQLCKQLLGMTQQMMSRQSSFELKDYNVFVNAYVDAMQKVMDATYQLVSIILDLQRAERQGLMNESRSQSIQDHSVPPPQNFQPPMADQRRQMQEKQHLLSRLHSESNATSLSVADVRQLHEDLGKLRQLLNTETRIPSFSGVGSNPQVLYNNTGQDFRSEFDYTVDENESDAMSAISCSTCMPMEPDPTYYEREIETQPKRSREIVPVANNGIKQFDKVQYTEVTFPNEEAKEFYRPATRPPKQGGNLTLPIEVDEIPLFPAIPTSTMGQVDKQKKADTLDPSSFSSFKDEKEKSNSAQRRHQAMLARYFDSEAPNGEVHRPPKTKELPQKFKQDLSSFPLHPAKMEGSSEVPMITMLPCGLVANDSPPIFNPPKEKRKLTNIPEITVVRNGAEEVSSNMVNEERREHDQMDLANKTPDEINVRAPEENLNDSYHSTDTLPLKEVDRIPELSESEIEVPVVSDSEETSPKVPCSVDDDCELFYDKDVVSNLTDKVESFDDLNDEDVGVNEQTSTKVCSYHFGEANLESDSVSTNSNISAIEVNPREDNIPSEKEDTSESDDSSTKSSEDDSPEIDYDFGGGNFVDYSTYPRNREQNPQEVDSEEPTETIPTNSNTDNTNERCEDIPNPNGPKENGMENVNDSSPDTLSNQHSNNEPKDNTNIPNQENNETLKNEETNGKEFSSDEDAFDEKSRAILGDFPNNSPQKEEGNKGKDSSEGKSNSKLGWLPRF